MSYKEYKFSELCSITRGASPRPIHDYLAKEGMPWIKISDATAEKSPFIKKTKECIKHEGVRASVKVYKGDLILSNSATPGLPKFLEIDACIHDGWMLLRDFKNIRKEYAYWLLLNERVKLVAKGNGSVFTNLKTDILKNHIVKVPTFEVQDKAVSILDGLNNKINLLDETNKTLEAIAQAIFKSWFVDFDPVHAKQQGIECAGIDKTTADLFPNSFVESELGLIPKGWEVASIYEIAEIIYGAPFSSKLFNSDGNGIPILRIRDLKDENPVVYTTEKHIKGYLLKQGDIVVGMDGEFRAYLWGGNEVWLNQRVCVFKPLPNVSSAYVHLSTKPLLAMVEASETATTVIHIGKNDFDRFKIMIPSNHILDRFAELIDPVYKLIVNNKQSIKSLASLRDTLLPRLMSGKLDLSNIAEQIEGVP